MAIIVLVFNFFEDLDPENLALNSELTENEVRELAKKLSEKVHKEILLQEAYRKSGEAFLAERNLNSPPVDSFDHLKKGFSKNLQCPASDSTLPFLDPLLAFDSKQVVARVRKEYIDYLRSLGPDTLKDFINNALERRRKPNQTYRLIFQGKPRKRFIQLAKDVILDLKAVIIVLIVVSSVIFSLVFGYKLVILIYRTGIPFLEGSFQILLNKFWSKRSNSKIQAPIEEDEQEKIRDSNKFWGRPAGLLRKIINIGRGGSFVPLQEAPISQVSVLDQQEALGKFSRLKFRVRALISFEKPKISYTLLVYLLGISLIMSEANNGIRISPQTQNFPNVERVMSSQRFGMSIEEPKMITPIKTQLNQSVKTPSRLKSLEQRRKKAKLVRFSDLPPLGDEYFDFDLDIDVMPISRSTDIRIKTR